jgi:hypothetical protein
MSVVAVTVLGAALLAGPAAQGGTGAPDVGDTDVYAFVSPDRADSVTLVATWRPQAEPTFRAGRRLQILVDNDGDAQPDVTYRWTFTGQDARIVKLTEFRRGRSLLLASGRIGEVATLKGGGRTFAGRADDPMFAGPGRDTLAGRDVDAVAVQVPKVRLALARHPARNPVIGVWTTTSQRTGRTYELVSRAGNPLYPALVADAVTRRPDLAEIYLTGIAKDAPAPGDAGPPIRTNLNSPVLNLDADRAALARADLLRLNMSVPVTAKPRQLGALVGDHQGFPNGRRLGDDVADIVRRTVTGAVRAGRLAANPSPGDGVTANDRPFGRAFPHLAPAHEPKRATAAPAAGPAADRGRTAAVLDPVTLRIGAAALAALLLVAALLLIPRRRRRAYVPPTELQLTPQTLPRTHPQAAREQPAQPSPARTSPVS